MNLKKHFHIIWQPNVHWSQRRIRFLISVNRLEDYIPAKRAKFIRKKLLKSMQHKEKIVVQNKGDIIAYAK